MVDPESHLEPVTEERQIMIVNDQIEHPVGEYSAPYEEWLMEAIDAGAAACLLKEIPPPLLVTAIRQIVHGEWEPAAWTADWRSYAPQIQFRMRLSASRTDQDLDALTLREMEIVRRICSGDSNKEIAVGLHLSEGTVKNYVSAIYLKLGARHRAEAVRIARERLGY
jgi:two-component system, NarL family, response regulator DesR